jgi:phosphate transport system substrate-binding protein
MLRRLWFRQSLPEKVWLFLAITALCLTGFTGLTCLTGCVNTGPFNPERTVGVVSREDGSGTRVAFVDLLGIVEKNSDSTRKDRTTKEAVIAHQTGIMMTNISGNLHAIGYISLGSLNDTVKALAVDGAVPSGETVKDGTYPIVRPFILATRGEPTGLAKDFIDYILSAEGQEVVAKTYISVDDNGPSFISTKPAGRIVVAGSSSVTPVLEKLKEAYLDLNQSAAIEIQMTDSSTGMKSTIDGICDIGMSSRELTENERGQLIQTPIALDAITVIVNKNNPAVSLSKDQINAIFTGRVIVWQEVLP